MFLSVMLESEHRIAADLDGAGLIDRSGIGKIRVTGADRSDLLHRLSTNDLLNLKPFSSTGTIFTTDKGRIVDYVRVLAYPDSLLLITSPHQTARVRDWIDRYTIMEDIQLKDVTADEATFTLIGPKNLQVACSIFGKVPQANEFLVVSLGSTSLTLDHCQEFGINSASFFLGTKEASEWKDRALRREGEHGLISLDDTTYEYYRILHGIPASEELSDSFNPYEVNLRHAISFTKGCYIGQEVIARLDTYQKVRRELALLRFRERMPIKHSSLATVNKDGHQVGLLTSISGAEFGGEHVGLAVLRKDGVAIGDTIDVHSEDLNIEGYITKIFEQTPP